MQSGRQQALLEQAEDQGDDRDGQAERVHGPGAAGGDRHDPPGRQGGRQGGAPEADREHEDGEVERERGALRGHLTERAEAARGRGQDQEQHDDVGRAVGDRGGDPAGRGRVRFGRIARGEVREPDAQQPADRQRAGQRERQERAGAPAGQRLRAGARRAEPRDRAPVRALEIGLRPGPGLGPPGRRRGRQERALQARLLAAQEIADQLAGADPDPGGAMQPRLRLGELAAELGAQRGDLRLLRRRPGRGRRAEARLLLLDRGERLLRALLGQAGRIEDAAQGAGEVLVGQLIEVAALRQLLFRGIERGLPGRRQALERAGLIGLRRCGARRDRRQQQQRHHGGQDEGTHFRRAPPIDFRRSFGRADAARREPFEIPPYPMLQPAGRGSYVNRRGFPMAHRRGAALDVACPLEMRVRYGANCTEPRTMEWRHRISTDPAVCHGLACIKGTRIPVAVVLDNLAAGLSADEIVASYPPLVLDDVRAATAYAADLARERIVEIVEIGAA